MLDNDRFNKWFNAFILAGMTLVMIVMTLLELRDAESGRGLLIVAAFGSLMGVMSTVCSANARILTFLFGLFDVCIYGAMCFMSEKYGNAALHLLYPPTTGPRRAGWTAVSACCLPCFSLPVLRCAISSCTRFPGLPVWRGSLPRCPC